MNDGVGHILGCAVLSTVLGNTVCFGRTRKVLVVLVLLLVLVQLVLVLLALALPLLVLLASSVSGMIAFFDLRSVASSLLFPIVPGHLFCQRCQQDPTSHFRNFTQLSFP